MDKVNKKHNIIYVATNGHSGSTLLELLLNDIPSVWSLGSIAALPSDIKKENSICSCGSKVRNCNFWKESTKNISFDEKVCSPFRDGKTRKVLRWRELYDIYAKNNPSIKLHSKFCSYISKLFSQVLNTLQPDNQVSYLVSSSEGPYRLRWLNHCDDLNVKTIHIIKDPRAFVYSMVRKDKNLSFLKIIRMSVRYVIENKIIEKVSENSDYYLMKYEDLADNPNKTMNEVGEWLDVDIEEQSFSSFGKTKSHGIGKNKMKFSSNKEVILDEKWKYNFSSFYKNLVKLITYPVGKKYGYF